jgi:hypothetical protein
MALARPACGIGIDVTGDALPGAAVEKYGQPPAPGMISNRITVAFIACSNY